MNKKAFTVMEVCIAAGILTVFVGGIMALFSSGNKMGNSTIWLQSISNQLKNAARQINTSIRKSSYPSKFKFPNNVIVCDNNCFKLHYYNKTLTANDSNEASSVKNGTIFLKLTESTPAKEGFETSENHDATLIFHTFSLTKTGELIYTRYEESLASSGIKDSFTTSVPGSAPTVFKTTLTRNVDSVTCSKTDTNGQESIKIVINCKIPNGETSRSETAVGTPNVGIIEHSNAGEL